MDLNSLIKSQWDRVGAIALTVVGAVFLLVGWIGVSGSAYLAEQAPYIVSGGIGGVFFLGIGATLWISADLRDEWRKLDRIEAALGDGTLRWAEDGYDQQLGSGRPSRDLLADDDLPVRATTSAAPTRTAAVAATAGTTTRRTSTRTATPRPRTARTSGAES
ncbi:MAG: hypothetical protein ACXVGH_01325 [Mycobacteriales bacterium]